MVVWLLSDALCHKRQSLGRKASDHVLTSAYTTSCKYSVDTSALAALLCNLDAGQLESHMRALRGRQDLHTAHNRPSAADCAHHHRWVGTYVIAHSVICAGEMFDSARK
jgi:hypothetical protein